MNGIRWLLVAALAACTTTTPPELLRGWAPERRAVVVHVQQPRSEAYRYTVAAFTAEGLTAYGTFPEVFAQALDEFGADVIGRYRATVTKVGSGSEVMLFLYAKIGASAVPSSPEEVEGSEEYSLWRRLQRIADRLRAP